MAGYNLNALLQGGMDLAKAFGQQSPDDYLTTQTKIGQRDIAVGKARALADQTAARHGYEMTLINAGIPASQAKIMAASGAAGYNPDQMAEFLGKTQAQRFRDSIVERATAGDIPGAGAYSLGLATGPLEMTKITDGTAYNPYLQANQQVSTTPVGQSTINQRNAAAGASNASAASHYATAAKTRSDMNIGQEKFRLQKNGLWNESGKTSSANPDNLSAGERAKVRRDMMETRGALNNFVALKDALADIPNGGGLLTDGQSRGRLGTAYNNARASLRVLYNTGVLQPGELPMLEAALRDPTSTEALFDPRSRDQINSQLAELFRTTKRNIDTQVGSYPGMYNQQTYQQEYQKRAADLLPPQAGDTIDGYRFVGGDPSSSANWVRAK